MSQDIEIDPDSRTIKYYDSRTEQSIRDFIESGGKVLSRTDAITLLDEIDRLRKENTSLNQSAKSLAYVNHQLQKELFDQNQVMNELFQKAERLEKLIPPDSERGPGFVGQGSWSVFAEKVVAERDDARDELNTLCEDIRALKDENDDLREEVGQLGAMIAAKKEHVNVHYSKDEFIGNDGYGKFSLRKLGRDEWEVRMLQERVILYNKKGRRVRAQVVDGNPEGDW